jgi:hypothetical protein
MTLNLTWLNLDYFNAYYGRLDLIVYYICCHILPRVRFNRRGSYVIIGWLPILWLCVDLFRPEGVCVMLI